MFALLSLYRAFVGADLHKIIYRLALATTRGEDAFRGLFHNRFYVGHCEACASIGRYRARKRGSHFLVIRVCARVVAGGKRSKLPGECIAQKLGEKWDRFRGRGRGRGRGRS